MYKEYSTFLEYVISQFDGNEDEINVTLSRLDKFRCSLSAANERITDMIDDAIRDYCIDNDIDYYEFDAEETFDTCFENIFYDAIELMDII